jgi:hypothetical protein
LVGHVAGHFGRGDLAAVELSVFQASRVVLCGCDMKSRRNPKFELTAAGAQICSSLRGKING